MAEKNYRGAPFGTQTARFDVSGVHPKNKTPGTFTQTPYCKLSTHDLQRVRGPGRYNVDVGTFNIESVDERASGPGWARAYEVEKIAAMPHLLHKEQWELKRLLKRKLGPGTYNIKDFLESSEEKPRSSRGICMTKEQRFRSNVSDLYNTPGPGTYGDGGVPHAIKEDKERQAASTVGLLDAGSSTPRTLPMVGSHLGPGSYNFESFTDQMAKQMTSKRGPYDLFSGNRNKPITTGHLAVPNHAKLGPGQYKLKGFLDDLTSEHKKKQGKFGKVDQYPEKPSERILQTSLPQCPKEKEFPGPGSYDPKQLTKPQAKDSPGFLSSAQRNDRHAQKFFTRNFNPVGAGRYDIQKWEEAQHLNAHESAFRSKTGKLSLKREKFLNERVGARMPLSDRVYIVSPEGPMDYLMRDKTHTQYVARRAATIA